LYISTGFEIFKEFSVSNNGARKLLWSTLVLACVVVLSMESFYSAVAEHCLVHLFMRHKDC
jgi:hypothetical protein